VAPAGCLIRCFDVCTPSLALFLLIHISFCIRIVGLAFKGKERTVPPLLLLGSLGRRLKKSTGIQFKAVLDFDDYLTSLGPVPGVGPRSTFSRCGGSGLDVIELSLVLRRGRPWSRIASRGLYNLFCTDKSVREEKRTVNGRLTW
jgi:hypothetical protein